MKYLVIAMMSLIFTACAFDKDTGAENAQETAERERQLKNFSRVVGFYTGKLTTPSSQQDIELRLFTLEQESGTNSRGEERYILVLRGNYKKISPVGPGYNFKVRYIPETAELILTNDQSNLGVDDIHTINARLSNGKLVGEAKSIAGVMGVLEMSLSSAERDNPGNTEENEYYERLRLQYEAIAGTYQGDNIANGTTKFSFSIHLQVVKTEREPQLIGEFKRADDPSESVSLLLTAVYQPELSPPALTLTGVPRFNPTNSPYKATFKGVLVEGVYTGSWSTNIKGFEGNFTLMKKVAE